jgi:hypothetical protein
MSINLTDELKAHALEVASKYKPTRQVLLVGSCVWLGEGKDIDVVVFVDDASADRDGEQCSSVAYGGMIAYRHGPVNVIAVDDERIWAGWVHAAEVMPTVPKELIADKDDRVAACEKLREIGEKQCLSD